MLMCVSGTPSCTKTFPCHLGNWKRMLGRHLWQATEDGLLLTASKKLKMPGQSKLGNRSFPSWAADETIALANTWSPGWSLVTWHAELEHPEKSQEHQLRMVFYKPSKIWSPCYMFLVEYVRWRLRIGHCNNEAEIINIFVEVRFGGTVWLKVSLK